MALASKQAYSALPSLTYGAGLILVFVGERLLTSGPASIVATVAGVLAVVAGAGWQAARLGKRDSAHRGPEKALLTLYALGAVALLAYFFSSDVYFHLTGHTLQKTWPRVAAVLETLWPACLVLGTLPVVFVELSLASMARAPVRDLPRVRAAMTSGLGIGFALVFVFSFAFVASERDVKKDLSYFRVAKGGESTLKIVAALDKPVQVYLFFPPANEVHEEVESYFDDLKQKSKLLVVETYDQAINPAKAKELGVSGNGIIVVGRDKLREQIAIPLEMERARDQLKRLDEEVNKRLLGVTRAARVAYLTQGHGERSPSSMGDTDKRDTIGLIRGLLLDQGYEVRDLGLADGLGSAVPDDATIVMVIGPKEPFSPEEATSIERYIDRKGRVLLALDPESGQKFDNLLNHLGLTFSTTNLAHDQIYATRTFATSDRVNLISANYSSHVAVTTLSKYGRRLPVVFPTTGSLDNGTDPGGLVNRRFTIHADAKTWNDVNGNFEFDSGTEVRRAYELAAVVTKRTASAVLPEEEGRAVVLADSDALTDLAVRNQGNAAMFVDAVRWLGGEESISGRINNEEDVPIVHTRKQDLGWFYGSVVLAPALVVGFGLLFTRRSRKARKAVTKAEPPQAPPATNAVAKQEDSQ
ncbi:MAG: Gldg family protein [Deltaproteobacteria bacterium]|nr:Gldg family protein [Deltaproteobacteria bacterium]